MRLHVVAHAGPVVLDGLTPAHVAEAVGGRSRRPGLSVRSVQIIHATLRVMLAEAVRDELVERNVAAIVRAPAVATRRGPTMVA